MDKHTLQLARQVGQRIRAFRLERKWSQEDLGTRCWGHSRNYQPRIANYEQGASEPSFADLEIIAATLGQPIIAFFHRNVAVPASEGEPTVAWSDLVKRSVKHKGIVRVPILDDSCPPFLKGQTVWLDQELRLKHKDFVIVSHHHTQPIVCAFHNIRGRKYFKPLDGETPAFDYNKKTTYVFGVIISHQIHYR